MSKCFAMAVACGLAALGPEVALASPGSDNVPAIQAANGAGRSRLPLEGVVVTNPDWLSRPSGEDVERSYPPLAAAVGLSGRVVLLCVVSPLGMLGDCKVNVELPVGLGFGAAALRMASLFRMKPQTIDGAPVGGGKVNIPIRFEMDSPAPEQSPEPDKPASATTNALAHRLAVAMHGMSDSDFADKYIGLLLSPADAESASGDVDEPQRQIAIDALKGAFLADLPRIVDSTASALAGTYSERDLAKIADFAESAAGRSWFSKQIELQESAQSVYSAAWSKIKQDAAARFCARQACPQAPAPPP